MGKIIITVISAMLLGAQLQSQQEACRGTIFFSKFFPGAGSALYTLDPATLEYSYLSDLGVAINAMGFNPADQHLYAISGDKLVKINTGGEIVDMVPLPGLAEEQMWGGTFSEDGRFVLTGNGPHVLVLDLSGPTPIFISLREKHYVNSSQAGTPVFGDICFDPITGSYYGIDLTTHRLAVIDPATGGVDAFGAHIISQTSGAMFCSETGVLYCFLFDEIYAVSKATGAITLVGHGPPNTGGIDACSCLLYREKEVIQADEGRPPGPVPTTGETAALYIPNAFSPNADGINDLFTAFGSGISQFHLTIYDRWGERLFETSDIRSGWDGRFQGKPVNAGGYVYRIEVLFEDGEQIIRFGDVTLLR